MKKLRSIISFVLVLMLLTASAGAVDLYVDTELIETDTPPRWWMVEH